ncbi:MAG: response regulator transcription factor [Cyanobacteriota bacterium]
MTSILLVEDDKIISSLLKDLLVDKNYDVTHVGDGPDALKILEEKSFDLILLDENLPTMNGSEILINVKANPNLADIPIMIITSLDDEDFQAHVLNEGADDYIRKPFRMNVLLARINNVLKRANSSPKLEAEIPDGCKPETLNDRELNVLREVVKGHNNQTIAEELYLSEATVANYIKSIFAKLKTKNRTQTAIVALKLNLI